MPKLKRGSLEVHYEVMGSGAPLVLLRGLGRSTRHWLGYDRQLSRHFQVITIDARGLGRSSGVPDWKHSVRDLADDVTAVLDEVGLSKAHILGVSLGGMVAMAVGMYHPDRCESLILINSSIGGTGRLRISPLAIATLVTAAGHKKMRHWALSKVLLSKPIPRAKRQRIIDQWQEIEEVEGSPLPTVVRQLLAAIRFRHFRKLRSLALPALVLYGTKDRFVPNANSAKIAELIPHSKLVAIEGGGHELTLDCPIEVLTEIKAWVAQTCLRMEEISQSGVVSQL